MKLFVFALLMIAALGICWFFYTGLATEQTIFNCKQCGEESCPASTASKELLPLSGFGSPRFLESVLNVLTTFTDAVDAGQHFRSPPGTSFLRALHIHGEPSFGVVLKNHKDQTYWILLRGSKFYRDWLADVRQHQEPYDCGGNVHAGFLQILETIRFATLKSLPDASVPCKVLVTGHSLGAAVATLLALWLKKERPLADVSLMTSACPRVGDEAFCELVDDQVPRHVTLRNDADLVPTIPSAVTVNFRNPFKPFLYSRCGTVLLFNSNWKSVSNNHQISVYLAFAQALARGGSAGEEKNQDTKGYERPA